MRWRLYQITAISDSKDRAGVWFDTILFASIVINVILFGWQSITDNPDYNLFQQIYTVCFWSSISFYTLEWIIRLWVCVEEQSYAHPVIGRIRYLLTPLALMDTMVLLSAVLFGPGANIIFIRTIRLFDLARYIGEQNDYSPYQLLRRSILNKKEELLITLFGAVITLIICSYVVFFVERNAQPEILKSVTPSIKWVFGVLTNTETEGFQPVTDTGRLLQMIMTVIGVIIIGLPLGIITGGFISEIEDAKKGVQLRKNAEILIGAFSREGKIPVRSLVEQLNLRHDARRIDLDLISARLQYSQNEIFETVRASSVLRVRACRSSKEVLLEDNLILEYFPANTIFGVRQFTETGVHIVATQNYSDLGIGHYSRLLADTIKSGYYSNEYFSSAAIQPEKRINFGANSEYHEPGFREGTPFGEWKKCLYTVIKKNDWVIYMGTAASTSPADFHILCGGPKGEYRFAEMEESTVNNTAVVDKFFEGFLEDCTVLGLKAARQEHYSNTSRDHCTWALREHTGANVMMMYVNIGFLQFGDFTLYYRSMRALADRIQQHLINQV